MTQKVKFFISILTVLITVFTLGIVKVSAQTYCTPGYGAVNCTAGMDISNLSLAGATVSINNSTGCSTNGYGDYTSLNSPDLIQGQTYSISISTSYALPQFSDVRIWIDYDNDGIFSNAEEIASTNGNGLALLGPTSFNFTVPVSASPGTHRLRARLVYAAGGTIDPCSTNVNFGEAEDYTVQVVSGSTNCSGQPVAGQIQGNAAIDVCFNSSVDLEVVGTTAAGNMTYQWQRQSPSGSGVWINLIGGTNFTLTVLGSSLNPNAAYRFIATCNTSSQSDTSNIVVATVNNTATECYCVPEGTNVSRYIDSFSTNGALQNVINNNSGFSNNGYGIFLQDTIKQYKNEPVNFHVGYAPATFGPGSYGIKIWADWNQDGVFDTTELVFQSTSFDAGLIGSFVIPNTALTGTTRIRLGISSMSLAGPPSPCEVNYAFGEYEDYSLSILNSPICTGTPNAGQLADTVKVCIGMPVHLETIGASPTSGFSGLTAQWQYRQPAGTGTWQNITNANSLSSVFDSMTNVLVDFRLIYACGTNADTSNIMTTAYLPPSECYCIPQATNANRFINEFSTFQGVQNISNPNSGFSTNGYEFFSSDTITQKKGHTVLFTAYINGGTSGLKIWADYNQDGQFDGQDELIYQSSTHSVVHSSNFTIPIQALEGSTRLRIGSSWSSSVGPPSPCETNYSQGEYEDYVLTVLPCDLPVVNLGPDTSFCEGVTFILNNGNSDSAATSVWNVFSTADTLEVTGSGTYYVKVTDAYGCSNSDTVNVTMNPLPSADSISFQKTGTNTFSFSAINAQNANEYIWDFGDGAGSSDSTPTHSYSFNGEFLVQLIIKNDCGADTLSVLLKNTVAIDDIALGKNPILVYPNPGSNKVFIENKSNNEIEKYAVYNILGQKIMDNLRPDSKLNSIDVQQYSAGIYNLKVYFKNNQHVNLKFEIIR
ncbi:MAG TPA: GEVED domain-containing protein [Edaphocola sp.]|nr:GEVED domain-containing protein [Edaphocola sp.]